MKGNQGASLPRNLGWLKGFSILVWMWKVDQGASLPWFECGGSIKGLLYLDLDMEGRSRGFFTLIWMKGNQRASLPQNLGWLRGFSISILNCGDQRASLPRSWWKVTKGFLFLRTWDDWEASLSQSWIVVTKGLLYLDLDER